MIHKFLILAKQIYLSAVKLSEHAPEPAPSIELLLPIEVFWEVRDLLKQADYLISLGNEQPSVNEVYKKIYKKCAPYCVIELERNQLYAKA